MNTMLRLEPMITSDSLTLLKVVITISSIPKRSWQSLSQPINNQKVGWVGNYDSRATSDQIILYVILQSSNHSF